jgi:hypothetical protein
MSQWIAEMMIAVLVATPTVSLPQPSAGMANNDVRRVRSHDRVLASLIARATEQSLTFRRLMDTIDASDGFVYIEPGTCKHGVRACLVNVTAASGGRFVFVKVNVRRTNRELMAAMGHELQHASEVLSDPGVRDFRSLYFFYKDHALLETSMTFEPRGAIEAEETIAAEIAQFERSRGRD